MGGSIAVTIRKKNGEIHKMIRWTNPTPYFVENLKFIKKDEKYLQEYFDEKKNDPYYVDFCLAPEDYGLLLIDYMTNTILHSQNYTNYGSQHFSSLALSIFQHESDEIQNIKDLYDAKKLTFYKYVANTGWKRAELISFDKLIQIAMNREYLGKFEINMKPWKIKRFTQEKKDLKEMKKEIKKLGFKISIKENNVWKKFFRWST